MLLCFMLSVEAAIFSTIGLALQLPQEKWPGGKPQQNITRRKTLQYFIFLLTYFDAVLAKTRVGGLILRQ